MSQILKGAITIEHIKNAALYEKMVLPRLEALARMKDTLDGEFKLFSYMPQVYPFYTKIEADYLISHHSDITSFVFIIQANADGFAKCDYLCCSAFKQGEKDYEQNQRPRTILKKERIHLPSNTSVIYFNKINPK